MTTYERGANKTEWVLDTKQLSQGVVVARSLLPETGTKAFVRAINLSDQPQTLSLGLCMGGAEPAVMVGSGSPTDKPRHEPRQATSPGPATCCCGCSVPNGPLQPPSAGH